MRSRVDGYATKLGQIEAETAKIEDIKKQLAATTRITEEIQAEFSQKLWRERERMTWTRTKLEDALTAAYAIREKAGRRMSECSKGEPLEDDDEARNRLSSIVALNLPSLRIAASELNLAALNMGTHVIAINGAARVVRVYPDDDPAAADALGKYRALLTERTGPMRAEYGNVLDAVNKFQRLATEEMARHLP